MRRPKFAALVLALLAGCSRADPDTPDAVTVYSLDPESTYDRRSERTPVPPGVEALHEWDVLGRVEVTDPVVRREVVAAVRESIAAPGTAYKCYDPRHAVRVVRGGRTVEFVICFQCSQYVEYRDGVSPSGGQTLGIGSAAKPLLDQLLADAGVPLSRSPQARGG